jgi:hypothetical protein
MEYNVPQFVEEEARILGPFTLRDFFILLGAFLLSVTFFFAFRLWLAVILATIVMGGTGAMLLLRVNGRPLYTIALSALQFFWSPRLYLWKKEGVKPEEMLQERRGAKKPEAPARKESPNASRPLTPEAIKKLAQQLDVK